MDFKSQPLFFSPIITKHRIPLNEIEDLNEVFDKHKNKLDSIGHGLIGRIKSELDIGGLIEKTKIYNSMKKCIEYHMQTLHDFGHSKLTKLNIEIQSCWINDMKEGEYNPPHIHNHAIGYSSVMFLKVPKFVNDSNKPLEKFNDGKLGFIGEKYIEYIDPVVGDFYIFEAEHKHFVNPFKIKNKNENRRSMAFNFIQKS